MRCTCHAKHRVFVIWNALQTNKIKYLNKICAHILYINFICILDTINSKTSAEHKSWKSATTKKQKKRATNSHEKTPRGCGRLGTIPTPGVQKFLVSWGSMTKCVLFLLSALLSVCVPAVATESTEFIHYNLRHNSSLGKQTECKEPHVKSGNCHWMGTIDCCFCCADACINLKRKHALNRNQIPLIVHTKHDARLRLFETMCASDIEI